MRRISNLVSIPVVLALALAAGFSGSALAQGDGDLAEHPLTGTWLAMANPPLPEDPQVPAPSLFSADGSVLLMLPATQLGPDGVQFATPLVGVWEAHDERRGHFTATQSLSDVDGTFLGTVTIDGYPLVSEDGLTFVDDNSLVTVTIRDAAGAIVAQFPGAEARPVTAIRMGPGLAGFPEIPDASASPAP